jgi:hypothetical protein
MSFFAHISGAGVGLTATLPETTYSGVLGSIMADLSTSIASGTSYNWTLYDTQTGSAGAATPIIAFGNIGGLDYQTAAGQAVWNSGSLSSSTNGWGTNVGNGAGTELYASRTLIGLGPSGNFNWYEVATTPGVSGGASGYWGFSLSSSYSGTGFTGSYGVKLQNYIVLKNNSTIKPFYVLIARPDSACDILRIQVFETWNSGTGTGTLGSNMEIMRGTDSPDTTFYGPGTGSLSWDAQPVRYMIWFLQEALALWVSFGSGPTQRVIRYDFAYAGNLDTTNLRSGDTDALAFLCSNTQLSGFFAFLNAGVQYNQNSYTSAYYGCTGGARVLRTVQGEGWGMPGGIQGTVSTRPFNWNMNNQYQVWSRGMPAFYGIDRASLDFRGNMQFSELDLYHMGGTGQLSASQGFSYNECKRGQLRYVRVPIMNPTGGHLVTYGPADDGNTYVLFNAHYPQQPATSGTSYNSNDAGVNGAFTSFGAAGKLAGGGTIAQPGELLIPGQAGITQFGHFHRWFMMPINL